jgi:hypothetical protein
MMLDDIFAGEAMGGRDREHDETNRYLEGL